MVSVYGWADYIDPKVIEDFTRETGITVSYDAYDSTAALEKRLAVGNGGFDVVIVPGEVLRRQSGHFQKLDKARLPNSKNLWPEVMTRLEAFDPGNQYAVSYLWFTAGIAYNIDKVKESLGSTEAEDLPAPLASWAALFQLDNLKKLASCGVVVLDSAEDMFALALIYLKGDPAVVHGSDLKRAAELLSVMRRNVKRFDPSSFADELASGDVCLAVGYSVDGLRASERAQEADNGVEIGYVVPKEGALIALDNLAILKDAPHLAEAYALINFLLRPEIAARNTDFTRLASGVLAARSTADRDIAANEWVYPDASAMQRLVATPAYDGAVQKTMQHEWVRIKAGK
jgi:putrescine transport system substrate-binding protein